METNYLKSFKIVYETRSITKAAKQLFITPQGLSKIIQQLERNTGVVLFERTNHGVEPTESASFLYDRLNDILPKFESIEHAMVRISQNRREIRLGIACGAWNMIPMEKISKVCTLNISFKEYAAEDVKKLVSDGLLDCGIIIGGCDCPDLISERIGRSEICLFVYEGHPLYDHDKISLDMLGDTPLIVLNEQYHTYQKFYSACMERDIRPNIVMRTGDSLFLHKVCTNHIYAAVFPSVGANFSESELKAIPFTEQLNWDVSVIRRNDAESRTDITELINLLTHS